MSEIDACISLYKEICYISLMFFKASLMTLVMWKFIKIQKLQFLLQWLLTQWKYAEIVYWMTLWANDCQLFSVYTGYNIYFYASCRFPWVGRTYFAIMFWDWKSNCLSDTISNYMNIDSQRSAEKWCLSLLTAAFCKSKPTVLYLTDNMTKFPLLNCLVIIK